MFDWLNITAFMKRRRDHGFLRPSVEFREILERERMRADRNGQVFSLLVLVAHGKPSSSETISTIETVLAQRLRATDIAGLLQNDSVAALLPDTSVEGAWKLADDILAMIPEQLPRPSCAVHAYPVLPRRPRSESARHGIPGPKNGSHVVGDSVPQTTEDVPADVAIADLLMKSTPVWKRGMDVVGAMIGLVIAFPVMLLAAIAIKLTTPGPVFFRQTRAGFGERPFEMYKFRTMHVGAESLQAELRKQSEQDGPAFKMSDDPRTTRVGEFLRHTSIDELPQLWNVLRGEMALVGPRPLPGDESDGCERWHRRRLAIVPGITCVWQVYGRSKVSFVEWMRMDLCYIRDRSLQKDLRLLVRTVPAVLFGRGAK